MKLAFGKTVSGAESNGAFRPVSLLKPKSKLSFNSVAFHSAHALREFETLSFLHSKGRLSFKDNLLKTFSINH